MKKSTLNILRLAALLTFASAGVAQATNEVWQGASGDNWTNQGNWNPGLPGTADTAVFTSAGNFTVNVSGTLAFAKSVLFDTTAGSYTIGNASSTNLMLSTGGSIQLANTLAGSGLTETFNGPIVLGSGTGNIAYAFSNDAAATSTKLVISGTLTSGSTSGVTTLTLSGSNTGNNLLSSNLSDGTGTNTVALVKTGIGAWTLSGTNTFSGGVTSSSGTLYINSASALGSGALNLNGTSANVTIDNTSGSAITLANTPTLNLTGTAFTFGGTNNLNFGNGTFTIGAGTGSVFTMLGTANLTVGTYINTQNVNRSFIVNGPGTGQFIIQGMYLSNPTSNANFGMTISGSGNITVYNIQNGSTPVTHGLAYTGTGTLTLASANGNTGGFNVNGGTVILGDNNSLGMIYNNQLTSEGGTVYLQGHSVEVSGLTGTNTSAVIANGSATTNSTFHVNNNSSSSYKGALKDGGAATLGLLKSNSGSLTLQNTSTYTGTTTILGGALVLGDATNTGAISSSSSLVLGGGALTMIDGAGNVKQAFNGTTIAGGVAINNVTATNSLTLGALSRTAGGVDFTTLNGSITTTTVNNSAGIIGGWATVGGSNWATSINGTISAYNSYAAMTLSGTNDSTLNVATGSATMTGTQSINSLKLTAFGGTLNNGGFDITVSGTSGGILFSSSYTITGAGIVGAGASNELIVSVFSLGTINSQIIGNNGSGSLTKTGSGKLVLNSANNYTGGTYISNGTITAGNTASLGAAGAAVTMGYGTTLDLATDTSSNAYNLNVLGNATIISDRATSGNGITHQLGNLSIGEARLSLTSGGSVTLSGTATSVISFGNVTLASTSGAVTQFDPTTANLTLNSVTGSATAGNFDTLYLGGTSNSSTALNNNVGAISDGAGGGKVNVVFQSTGSPQTPGVWNLNGANTYTGPTSINQTGVVVNLNGSMGNSLVYLLAGTLNLNSAGAINQNLVDITTGTLNESVVNAISGNASLQLTTSATGKVNLTQANNFTGTTSVYGGTLVLSDANAVASSALNLSGGTLALRSDTNTLFNAASISTLGSTTIDVGQLSSGAAGATLWLGTLNSTGPNNASTYTFTNGQGYNLGINSLVLPGGVATTQTFNNNMVNGTLFIGSITDTAPAADTIAFGGTSTSAITNVTGPINKSGSGTTSVKVASSGKVIFNGAANYTGGTTITTGSLIVTNASGLGTGVVSLTGTTAAPGALNYYANTDAQLAIGGTLTLNGVAAPIAIGSSIGSTTTSAEINVAQKAIATGNISVNIYGANGTNRTSGSGTYTLVSSSVASSTLNGAAYTLGSVFNNTDFTVGALTTTGTTVKVGITAQTALTSAYWKGGFSGATNTWAISNGTSSSNWGTSDGSNSVQALVPGSTTSVFITGNNMNNGANPSVLGANMSILGLTVSDTTNGVNLAADGNSLTVGTGGITIASGVPSSTIAANVVLGGNQTWANNSGNTFTASGAISGTGSLVLSGSGTTVLSGANTYTGGTEVGVNAVLKVSNGLGSATGTGNFQLDSGAKLIGTGIISSTTNTINGTVQSGANPLATVGSLTLLSSGTTTVGASGNLVFNLAASGSNNSINVGSSAVAFISGATLSLNLLDSSTIDYANGTNYLLIAGTSSSQYSGFTVDGANHISGLNFNLIGTSTTAQADSLYYGASYLFMNNGNIEIAIISVPEPGMWAMLIGGLAVLLVFQRKRRSTR